MRITPTRAIAWMWLLCSVWLPGIWFLQRLLPQPGASGPLAALPVLGGGLVLLLLAALFLALSVRIEQTRLRMAVRALLRGEPAPQIASEWRGLLDDVRLATRRVGLERERLALRAQEAEDAVRAQGERSGDAARTAQESLRQVEQQWRMLLPLLPSAADGEQRLQVLQGTAAKLEVARAEAAGLQGGVERTDEALRQLRDAVAELLGCTQRDFLRRASPLAESMQLLSLNFRLVLERMELLPGAAGEGLETLVQDLEPLCQQATSLVEWLPRVDSGQHDPVARVVLPLEQALQPLAAQVGKVLAALQHAHGAVQALLPEAREAATHDVRGVLEQSLDYLTRPTQDGASPTEAVSVAA